MTTVEGTAGQTGTREEVKSRPEAEENFFVKN